MSSLVAASYQIRSLPIRCPNCNCTITSAKNSTYTKIILFLTFQGPQKNKDIQAKFKTSMKSNVNKALWQLRQQNIIKLNSERRYETI